MQATETQGAAKAASKKEEAPCMASEPQQEHRWLHKMIGEWTCEGEATMEPGKPPAKWSSKEVVRSIGGRWIVGESEGEMPGGGAATTIITLGYDPAKKQFVGNFIGSMMNNMWIYEGSLDASEKVLTLDTEGPDMGGSGKPAKFQDIMEIKSDDHRVLTSRMLGEDGTWNTVMTATYRRTK